VVGRDDVPRRVLGARGRQHLGERPLVVVPARTLPDVGRRELPVPLRDVDPLQEALPLLLLGQVQEDLDDGEPVVDQIALPVVDLPVATAPDVLAGGVVARRRQSLPSQGLGVDPDDEHLLVVRPVEDPDLAPGGQGTGVAPQVVVAELRRRRDLETADAHTLRVHPAHDVPDRPVLAACVQRLQA